MKIALVTGAGRVGALGFETARQLGGLGFHVVLTARKVGQAEERARELQAEGLAVTPLHLDITDEDSVHRAVEFVRERFGRLDVLINNAAVLMESPESDFKTDLVSACSQFDTNLFGTWRMAQEFHPLLKAAGSARIVNVSSGSGSFWDCGFGLVNNPGFEMAQFGDVSIAAYQLSKLAINGLTLKLAQDYRNDNILVNAICPGLASTRPGAPGRSPEDGARSIVWGATLSDHGPTGMFFRDGKQLPW